jgi:hypothetical protein
MKKLTWLLFLLVLAGCRQAQSPPPRAIGNGAEPPITRPGPVERTPFHARGLYATGWSAGSSAALARLVGIIDRTELNAIVIDIKDGKVSYHVDVPLAYEAHAVPPMIADIDEVMQLLREHDIYPIARIVVFRDSEVAKARPDLAVQNPDGSVWVDRGGYAWLNPYNKRTWEYNVAIAKDAVKRGFKEIQFDYVRTPSEGRVSEIVFPGEEEYEGENPITDFVQYATAELKPLGAWVSVDIFGLTSSVNHDMGIRQILDAVAKHADLVCPMLYPSHYAKPELGLRDPELAPYEIVTKSLSAGLERLHGSDCRIRPWLQDFSRHSTYGPEQVLSQIRAVKDLGIDEYLIWNPRNRYTEEAMLKAADLEVGKRLDSPEPARESEGAAGSGTGGM